MKYEPVKDHAERKRILALIERCQKEQTRSAKEIDAYITACPYFGGKACIDRKILKDGMTHIGACALEFHYRKICPSEECLCAEKLGLKGADEE